MTTQVFRQNQNNSWDSRLIIDTPAPKKIKFIPRREGPINFGRRLPPELSRVGNSNILNYSGNAGSVFIVLPSKSSGPLQTTLTIEGGTAPNH